MPVFSSITNVWSELLNGESLSWVWTDSPYNVNYGGKSSSRSRHILNDNMPGKDFRVFLQKIFSNLYAVMAPGAAIYVAHSETERASFTDAFLSAGFKFSTCLIWRKNQMVLGRSDWQYIHEPILYGWKPGAAHYWAGGRKKTTVQELLSKQEITVSEDGYIFIDVGDDVISVHTDAVPDIRVLKTSVITVPKPKKNDLHPTMKPVELIERCLRASARPGSIGGGPIWGIRIDIDCCRAVGFACENH